MLTTGILLLAIGILTFGEASALLDRQDAPAWTKQGWASEASAILFVGLIGLGVTSLIAGLFASDTGPGFADAAILVVGVAATVMIWRWRKQARRQAAHVQTPAHVRAPARTEDARIVELGTDDRDLPPPEAPKPRGPVRRAA